MTEGDSINESINKANINGSKCIKIEAKPDKNKNNKKKKL